MKPTPAIECGLGDLAGRYLGALLDARRRDASDLIMAAVESGEYGVRRLYLEVFEPVLYEVGRLWERNQVSIAQEHFISATTQLLMSRLYPQIFAAERRGSTLVATCAGPELHEIGLRMVADFFELEGWDTYYLGANLPVDAVIDAVRQRDAELLALSATMPGHRAHIGEVIDGIRRIPGLSELRIIVGGGAFRREAEAWRVVGADGVADNAQAAVDLAGELCRSRGPRP